MKINFTLHLANDGTANYEAAIRAGDSTTIVQEHNVDPLGYEQFRYEVLADTLEILLDIIGDTLQIDENIIDKVEAGIYPDKIDQDDYFGFYG